MTHQEHIQRAIGITADEYAHAVEQGGYIWIERYFKGDELMIKVLSSSKDFWKWWINQWEIRDEVFVRATGVDLIDSPLEGKYWQAAFKDYCELHDAMKLDTRPPRCILEHLSELIEKEEEKLESLKKQ